MKEDSVELDIAERCSTCAEVASVKSFPQKPLQRFRRAKVSKLLRSSRCGPILILGSRSLSVVLLRALGDLVSSR